MVESRILRISNAFAKAVSTSFVTLCLQSTDVDLFFKNVFVVPKKSKARGATYLNVSDIAKYVAKVFI